MKEYIIKYKKYMDEHMFYEAHEALEEFWFPRRKQKDKITLIIKGFINAAVSMELKKRGRLENHKKIWQVYEKFAKLIDKDDTDFIELKKYIDRFKDIEF